MASVVMTWIVSPGIGILVLRSWLRADCRRPQAHPVNEYPPFVVAGHLAFIAGGITLWVAWVVKGNGPGLWFGFVDLLIFAGVGDELLLQWTRGWRREPSTRALSARVDVLADDPMQAGRHFPT